MNSKSRSAIPLLLSISFVLFAILVLSTRPEVAQDQGSTSQNPCACWMDVYTEQPSRSVPIVPTGVAKLSADGKTAFDPITKRSFALEPGGCWIDVYTEQRARSVPIVPTGVAKLSADGKTAFDPITKRSFTFEACPPRTEKKAIEEKKDSSSPVHHRTHRRRKRIHAKGQTSTRPKPGNGA
jgi:hypothetical protein